MTIDIPINVRLIVALGNQHFGPIPLRLYAHHTPEKLASTALDEPLKIPPAMRTGRPRHVYSERLKIQLEPSIGYAKQHVRDGDILFLTDVADDRMLAMLSPVLASIHNVSLTDASPADGRIRAVLRGFCEGIPRVGLGLSAHLFGSKRGG